jgi:hypothetical protein
VFRNSRVVVSRRLLWHAHAARTRKRGTRTNLENDGLHDRDGDGRIVLSWILDRYILMDRSG